MSLLSELSFFPQGVWKGFFLFLFFFLPQVRKLRSPVAKWVVLLLLETWRSLWLGAGRNFFFF